MTTFEKYVLLLMFNSCDKRYIEIKNRKTNQAIPLYKYSNEIGYCNVALCLFLISQPQAVPPARR